jgi:hypothetical protein
MRPLSDKMLAWLRLLEVKPGSVRSRNNIGYRCMQRGLTEWNWLDYLGNPISLDEATERFGFQHRWSHIRSEGERLTERGRELLKTYE